MDPIPYCGPAPVPADLWSAWNFDPLLLAAMAAGMLAHAAWLVRSHDGGRDIIRKADDPPPAHSRASGNPTKPNQQILGPRFRGDERRGNQTREFRISRPRIAYAAAGWAVLAVAFVSPLCALASALFSARVGHHALMVAVAAPLFILSLPPSARRLRIGGGLAAAAALLAHTAAMWFWHAPAPYAAALASHALYWLMEATLMGSALALWLVALSPRASLGTAMTTLLGAMMQMGLIGAVITFAPAPLYAPHAMTTAAFGLTALADQQLAGLIMWVPAALPYLVAALALAGLHLGRAADPAREIR